MVLSALSLLCLSQDPSRLSDQQMLSMGHQAYMQAVRQAHPDDKGHWVAGEKRYQLQVGYRKERLIREHPNRNHFDRLDILLANLTKGACRASDAFLHETSDQLLLNAKASTAMVLTMEAIITNQLTSAVLQDEVWRTYREVRQVQTVERDRIASYAQRGGFSVEQQGYTMDAIGKAIFDSVALMKDASVDQKSHLFSLAIRLLRLTVGHDPLPY
ncbi:MAG TPA: hypothetical protein PKA27_13165 [Fimbriimonadaceae bacterium]|nr:hypothetical protein [Fimbriimonadaceae bacterium]